MLTSCNGKTVENENQINTSKSEPVEHILFFFDSGGSSARTYDTEELSDQKVKEELDRFKSAVWYPGGKINATKSSATDDTIDVSINGKRYTAEYYETYKPKVLANDKFGDSVNYDLYKTEDISIERRTQTNQILFFSDSSKKDVSGTMTESRVREIADSVLKSVYGQDADQEYIYTEICDGNPYPNNVIYTKYVWGVPTNDTIVISLNGNGELGYINARMLGAYNDAEKNVTKEEVDNAINYLNEKLSEKYDIAKTQLIINSNAEYYIEAYVVSKTPDNYMGTVYVNIK